MKKRYVSLQLALLCMVGFLCFSVNGFGQTPSSNCDITIATAELPVGATCTTAPWNSTNDTDYWNANYTCNAADWDDAWGWFTATSTSTTITYTPAPARDAILHLFTGACSPTMTSLACSDNIGNGVPETIVYPTVIGTVYMVRIQRFEFDNTANGNMQGTICVYNTPPPPANDLCANGINLPCGTTNLAGTTNFTTNVPVTIGCSMSTYGVWYNFVGNGDQTTVSSTSAAGFDHKMAISTGTNCGSYTNIACVDVQGGGGTESATFITTNGVPYYVYIAYYGTFGTSSNTGNFTISRSCTPVTPPANDEPCAATVAPVNTNLTCTTVVPGTIQFATDSGIASTCGGTHNDDVWYRFTATATVHNISLNNVTGNTTDLYHAVYSGACGGLTLIPGTCSDPNNSTLTGLTIGTTYYIQVYSYNNGNYNTTFNLCITTPPPPPANDLCANATNLPCGTTNLTGTTNNTTNTPVTIGCSMSNYGVWYTFVGDGQQSTIVVDATFDATIAVASGTCGTLTNLACNDTGNPETYSFVTTVGVTYYIYVAHWLAGSTTTGTFTISRTCVPVVVPPNDLCDNATALPCGTTNLAGTTNFTTNVPTISGCTMSNYGVWYTFLGDGQSSTISSTSAAGFDHEMSISTGNCVNQFNVACVDNVGGGNTETYTFNTTSGVQYYVYIAYTSTFGNNTGNFTISRSCAPPSYCIPSSTSSSYYINNFTTTGGSTNINHINSGFSAGGYGNFPARNVTQLPGGVINFNITFVGGTFETNIWVDWNDDFDFDDANEKVYASTGYANPQAGSFTVWNGAPPGSHRMRVRSDYFNSDPASCGYDDQSETHDYTLIVTPLNCTANPSNVIATATSTTTATISWTAAAPPPGVGYDYVVSTSPTGTPVIASGTTAGTTVNITGLTAGTTYYVFVRGNCNATDQGYWVTTTVTTGCTTVVTTPTTCPLIVDVQGNNPFTTIPFIADPMAEIDCDTPNVTLAANANLRQTTSYIVEQITYPNPAPVYDFPALGSTNQQIANDDVWADTATNLGFNFCFYGQTYNQIVAGANSMITFNAGVAGTYSGWEFDRDLPSTNKALFLQTIYGVYHDIDPRGLPAGAIKSRTVGTVGCRQFQVSWNDVPMFGDATRVYTGMIVLHETTNIIEVFIKEKRIENGNVGPWNGGNALVGIQGVVNPTAQYSVAPCRNSLDANWETTNEAWRFTPNGAVINPVSVTWYQGSIAPGNIIANTPTVNVSTGNTYFASVNYNLCSGPVTLVDEIVVNDIRKVWNGSVSTDWDTPANWTPNTIPVITNCILVPVTASLRYPVISEGQDGLGRNITINDGASLTIKSDTTPPLPYSNGGTLTIQDWVNVNAGGDFLIEDNASLVQITDVAANNNVGNIRMQRTVPGGVGAQQYVYWSSPVEDFDVGDINDAPSELRWQWEPTTVNVYGNWTSASGLMTEGRGYIVRGLTNTLANTAEFSGVPNNGIMNVPINRGNHLFADGDYPGAGNNVATYMDDNWNLVGNPYPSAISGAAFITANATGPTPNIDGTIYLWSHLGLPVYDTNADPFYGNYVWNYLGSNYVAYNGTGPNPPFNGNIAAGQSFFVQMTDLVGTAPAYASTVTFNNTMRSATLANGNFLRTSERHRIWLNLINQVNDASSTLVGYVTEATNDKDILYDGNDLSDTTLRLYSLIAEEKMTIQGRALPFDQEDRVPLGFMVPQNGSYKIAIHSVDGLFDDPSQNIYLEDTYLNTIFDLRTDPYTFTSESGTFNDRFILRYTNQTLSTPDEVANFGFNIIGLNDYIKVTSGSSPINTIVVYDVLGRVLADYKNVNALEFKLNLVNQSKGTLIVKATLYNGQQKIKKVIY